MQSLFTDFVNEKFEVNRAYQRKLVWTQKEKEFLIDSILNQLPIPLILLAKDQSGKYEIVDGLQRINAIVGFLRNEFPLGNQYFDLERLGDTKELRDRGEIEQKTPMLSPEECRILFNYEVPVSVYTSRDDSEVEEVFRRINSSGRHLSRQDIRQAGATGPLPDIVRDISSSVRGDVSFSTVVPLSRMSQISISDGFSDGPGISVNEIFWVKHGVLDADSIRESKDEELVLDILLDTLPDRIVATEARKRDQAYGIKSDTAAPKHFVQGINNSISRRGKEGVKEDFLGVFDEIRTLLSESGRTWRDLTSPGTDAKVAGRYFQLMFVPFYDLMIKNNKVIKDRAGLIESLKDFWSAAKIDVPKGGGTLSIENKERIYGQVKARIEKFFTDGDPEIARENNLRLRRFESDLMRSLTESSAFEIKLGITDLNSGELNEDLLNRLPKIAAAIANTHPNGEGTIYIGVTDATEKAEKLRAEGYNSLTVNVFQCLGVALDKNRLHLSTEEYQNRIRKSFTDTAKANDADVYRSVEIESFDYHGLEIVSVRFPAIRKPIPHGTSFFKRRGSHTEPVKLEDLHEFMDAFNRDIAKSVNASQDPAESVSN